MWFEGWGRQGFQSHVSLSACPQCVCAYPLYISRALMVHSLCDVTFKETYSTNSNEKPFSLSAVYHKTYRWEENTSIQTYQKSSLPITATFNDIHLETAAPPKSLYFTDSKVQKPSISKAKSLPLFFFLLLSLYSSSFLPRKPQHFLI